MRVALDSNVLASAEGVNDGVKRDIVAGLLNALSPDSVVIPIQVLGELFNVLVRKAGRSRSEARQALMSSHDTFATIPTTVEVMSAAGVLATVHRMSIWDAVIVAAASQAGCRILLSEDLQDGFAWGGVTVIDPFGSPRDTLLQALPRQPI